MRPRNLLIPIRTNIRTSSSYTLSILEPSSSLSTSYFLSSIETIPPVSIRRLSSLPFSLSSLVRSCAPVNESKLRHRSDLTRRWQFHIPFSTHVRCHPKPNDLQQKTHLCKTAHPSLYSIRLQLLHHIGPRSCLSSTRNLLLFFSFFFEPIVAPNERRTLPTDVL